jgi:hypothetical protein
MIIDFKDKIELPDKMKSKFFNELQALANLWQGMYFIYKFAGEIEQKANEKISDGTVLQNMPPEARKSFEGKDIRYTSGGNAPTLNWLDKGLHYSLFQWYAVSACNYVLLVGHIAKQVNPESQKPIKYVEKVIPDVQWFRDKIAAHPAKACDDKRDNDADRIASVLYQVVFDNRRFYAPAWRVTVGKKGQQITSTNTGTWSITETHERLVQRYSPQTEKL